MNILILIFNIYIYIYNIKNIILINPQNSVIIYKIGFKQMIGVLAKSLTLPEDELEFEQLKKILVNLNLFNSILKKKYNTI